MGLLDQGTALLWPQLTPQIIEQVRLWAVVQLLSLFSTHKSRDNDPPLWGDEVEYIIVKFDPSSHNVQLSLQHDLLESINENALGNTSKPSGTFHPEFGRFMIESTPAEPLSLGIKDIMGLESNMLQRRKLAQAYLPKNQFVMTMAMFPLLGVPHSLFPDKYNVYGPVMRSLFVPDEVTNPHIRFPTLAGNIRARRGDKNVDIQIPIFRDTFTPFPWRDPTVFSTISKISPHPAPVLPTIKPNHLYLDSMVFGMGSCCLQITLQTKNVDQARLLHDLLVPLGPIMLAMTAATPVYKGYLVDTDARWNQISASVDDRTSQELDTPRNPDAPLPHCILKSRYSTNSTYLRASESTQEKLDERDGKYGIDLRVNENSKQLLLNPSLIGTANTNSSSPASRDVLRKMEPMDSILARHFAYLFLRDPLVNFKEDVFASSSETYSSIPASTPAFKSLADILHTTQHFENFQSTNWHHVRFKPPPPYNEADSDKSNNIGWRVEFRPMEIQFTDRENAAFAVFTVLLSHALLRSWDSTRAFPYRNVDLRIHLDQVNENMEKAHLRDAVTEERFYWRLQARNDLPAFTGSVTDTLACEAHTSQSSRIPSSFVHKSNKLPPTAIKPPPSRVYTVGNRNEVPLYVAKSGVYGKLTVEQIFSGWNGQYTTFPGLIPLVEAFVEAEYGIPLTSTETDSFSATKTFTLNNSNKRRNSSPGLSSNDYEYDKLTAKTSSQVRVIKQPRLSQEHSYARDQAGLKDGMRSGNKGDIPSQVLNESDCNSEVAPGDAEKDDTVSRLVEYIAFIRARSQGLVVTNAQWLRENIRAHPRYALDSFVDATVVYDIMKQTLEMNGMNIEDPIQEKTFQKSTTITATRNTDVPFNASVNATFSSETSSGQTDVEITREDGIEA